MSHLLNAWRAASETRTRAQRDVWDAYRPHPGFFLTNARGLHGLAHSARVLVWADAIARAEGERGRPVDLEVVHRLAVLHDVRREDDGRDPEHGARCGAWIGRSLLLEGALEAPRHLLLNQWAGDLTVEQWRQVQYGCVWHVPPDREAPRMTAELMCLKDADALDRARLGGLDIRLLRTDAARCFVPHAELLWALSEADSTLRADPWQAVRRAACSMGLWASYGSVAGWLPRARYFAL